jgi:hypothetical protein
MEGWGWRGGDGGVGMEGVGMEGWGVGDCTVYLSVYVRWWYCAVGHCALSAWSHPPFPLTSPLQYTPPANPTDYQRITNGLPTDSQRIPKGGTNALRVLLLLLVVVVVVVVAHTRCALTVAQSHLLIVHPPLPTRTPSPPCRIVTMRLTRGGARPAKEARVPKRCVTGRNRS